MNEKVLIDEINDIEECIKEYSVQLLVEFKNKKFEDYSKGIYIATEELNAHLKELVQIEKYLRSVRERIDTNTLGVSYNYLNSVLFSFKNILVNSKEKSQKKWILDLLYKKINRYKKEQKIDELVKSLDDSSILRISPTKIFYAVITKLFYENKIIQSDIENLMDDKWCEENFLIKKAAILPVDKSLEKDKQYIIDGKRMYFSRPYILGVREYYIYCFGTPKIKERVLDYYRYKIETLSLDEYLKKYMGESENVVLEENESENKDSFDFDVDDVADDIFNDAEKLLNWINQEV